LLGRDPERNRRSKRTRNRHQPILGSHLIMIPRLQGSPGDAVGLRRTASRRMFPPAFRIAACIGSIPGKLRASFAPDWSRGLTRKMQEATPKDVQNLGNVRKTLHMPEYLYHLTLLFSTVSIWRDNCTLDECLVKIVHGENLSRRDRNTIPDYGRRKCSRSMRFKRIISVQSRVRPKVSERKKTHSSSNQG
jgi:hypothetical protein